MPRPISAGIVVRSSSASASSSVPDGSGRGSQRRASIGRRLRRGRRVEQDADDVDSGDAVDERVVRLRDDREAVSSKPLHDPQLPQRLVAVEALREHPAGQVSQLLLAAGHRQRGHAHVVAEVEVGVVDPDAGAPGRAVPVRAAGGSAGPGAGAPRSTRAGPRSRAAGPRRSSPRRRACARPASSRCRKDASSPVRRSCAI